MLILFPTLNNSNDSASNDDNHVFPTLNNSNDSASDDGNHAENIFTPSSCDHAMYEYIDQIIGKIKDIFATAPFQMNPLEYSILSNNTNANTSIVQLNSNGNRPFDLEVNMLDVTTNPLGLKSLSLQSSISEAYVRPEVEVRPEPFISNINKLSGLSSNELGLRNDSINTESSFPNSSLSSLNSWTGINLVGNSVDQDSTSIALNTTASSATTKSSLDFCKAGK